MDKMERANRAKQQQAATDYLMSCSPAACGELRQEQMLKTFVPSLIAFCCIFVALVFGVSKYTAFPEDPQGQIDKYYQWVGASWPCSLRSSLAPTTTQYGLAGLKNSAAPNTLLFVFSLATNQPTTAWVFPWPCAGAV